MTTPTSREQEEERVRLEDLPSEVLACIFRCMDVRSLGTCERVCTTWRNFLASRGPLPEQNLARWVWRTVYQEEFGAGLPAPETRILDFAPDWRGLTIDAIRDYRRLPKEKLLQHAIYHGHDALLKRRLHELMEAHRSHTPQRGYSLLNRSELNPLHLGIKQGNLSTVRLLVESGYMKADDAALVIAASFASIDMFHHVLELLTKSKADPAQRGSTTRTQMLLESANKAFGFNPWYTIPRLLHIAACNSNQVLMKHIMQPQTGSPLIDETCAALGSNWVGVDFLVPFLSPASLNAQDSDGLPPIVLAVVNGAPPHTLQRLLDHGVVLDTEQNPLLEVFIPSGWLRLGEYAPQLTRGTLRPMLSDEGLAMMRIIVDHKLPIVRHREEILCTLLHGIRAVERTRDHAQGLSTFRALLALLEQHPHWQLDRMAVEHRPPTLVEALANAAPEIRNMLLQRGLVL